MDELTDAASSWASEVSLLLQPRGPFGKSLMLSFAMQVKKVAISQTAKRGFMGLF